MPGGLALTPFSQWEFSCPARKFTLVRCHLHLLQLRMFRNSATSILLAGGVPFDPFQYSSSADEFVDQQVRPTMRVMHHQFFARHHMQIQKVAQAVDCSVCCHLALQPRCCR